MIEDNAERQLAINHQSDKTLFITADATLKYGDVVDVIDAAKGAGVQRVGIVTDGIRRLAQIQ